MAAYSTPVVELSATVFRAFGDYVTLVICGTGFSYDADGALISGTVSFITLERHARAPAVDHSEWRQHPSTGNGPVPVAEIAAHLGLARWNDANVISAHDDRLGEIFDQTLYATPGAEPVNVLLGDRTANLLTGEADRDNDLVGRDGADELTGANHEDYLYGGRGEDRMDGGDGHDRLWGGADDDRMDGGDGDDALMGERGDDKIKGGDGDDTIWHSHGEDDAKGDDGADIFAFRRSATGEFTIDDFTFGDDMIAIGGVMRSRRAMDLFLDHAEQVGSDVVYEHDGLIVIVGDVQLDDLDRRAFTGDPGNWG